MGQGSVSRSLKGPLTLLLLGSSLALAVAALSLLQAPAPPSPPRTIDRLSLAKVHYVDREFDRAELLLRALLSERPDDRGARALLGRVLLDRGDRAEAGLLFSDLLRADPANEEARRGLAAALRGQGEPGLPVGLDGRPGPSRALSPFPAARPARQGLPDPDPLWNLTGSRGGAR